MSAITGTCRTCLGRRSRDCRACDGTGEETRLRIPRPLRQDCPHPPPIPCPPDDDTPEAPHE